MSTINHLFDLLRVPKIVKAFSSLWNEFNQFSLVDESELNACTRYAVADQITEELERKREQLTLDKLDRTKTEQPPQRIMYIH